MALINRISRLFRADLHAVLDRIEEPDLLLKQAIREMESAYAEQSQRSRLLKHELAQLNSRLQGWQEKLAGMDQELDICFQSDQESLARQLIRKKLELAQFAEQQQRRRDSLQQTLAELSRRQDENRTRLESLHQKARLLASDAAPDREHNSGGPEPIRVEEADVEVAFLREKQRRSQS